MGKFREIATELWPLIDVRNGFRSLSLVFFTEFLKSLHEI